MEDWFEEVKNGSHRDQLSFNYVAWKNKDIKVCYISKTIYKSAWFFWHKSHTKLKNNAPIKQQRPKITIQQLKKDFNKSLLKSRRVSTQQIGIYGL